MFLILNSQRYSDCKSCSLLAAPPILLHYFLLTKIAEYSCLVIWIPNAMKLKATVIRLEEGPKEKEKKKKWGR